VISATASEVSVVADSLRNAAKQARFAAAQTCNDCALAVQRATVSEWLPSKLTIRTPWATPGRKFGFNARFANRDNLESEIGTQAQWSELQQEGGAKKARGAGDVAIPTPFWKARQEIMVRAKKPRVILRYADSHAKKVAKAQAKEKQELAQGFWLDRKGKKRDLSDRRKKSVKIGVNALRKRQQVIGSAMFHPFKATVRANVRGIFVRTSKKRLPIKMLFRFVPSSNVPKRLEFIERGEKMVEGMFPERFAFRFASAMVTSK